jgi:GTPase Era involved in 16S rRNA processing
VAGNKLDARNKAVTMQDGQAFARKHNVKLISEVSAATGENIDQLVQKLAMTCYEHKDEFVSGKNPNMSVAVS